MGDYISQHLFPNTSLWSFCGMKLNHENMTPFLVSILQTSVLYKLLRN
jgi:hypothetical protein